MLSDNEFYGRFDASIAKNIKENCTDLNRVNLNDYEFSEAAMDTIGKSIKEMSLKLNIDSKELIPLMKKSLYEVKGDLVFLFDIEDIGEVVIVIPFGYFTSKNEVKVVH